MQPTCNHADGCASFFALLPVIFVPLPVISLTFR
jgi:hypothetical protein